MKREKRDGEASPPRAVRQTLRGMLAVTDDQIVERRRENAVRRIARSLLDDDPASGVTSPQGHEAREEKARRLSRLISTSMTHSLVGEARVLGATIRSPTTSPGGTPARPGASAFPGAGGVSPFLSATGTPSLSPTPAPAQAGDVSIKLRREATQPARSTPTTQQGPRGAMFRSTSLRR